MNIKKLIIVIASILLFLLMTLFISSFFSNITSSPYHTIINSFNLDLRGSTIINKEILDNKIIYEFKCDKKIINQLDDFSILPFTSEEISLLNNRVDINTTNGLYKIINEQSIKVGIYDLDNNTFYYYELGGKEE